VQTLFKKMVAPPCGSDQTNLNSGEFESLTGKQALPHSKPKPKKIILD